MQQTCRSSGGSARLRSVRCLRQPQEQCEEGEKEVRTNALLPVPAFSIPQSLLPLEQKFRWARGARKSPHQSARDPGHGNRTSGTPSGLSGSQGCSPSGHLSALRMGFCTRPSFLNVRARGKSIRCSRPYHSPASQWPTPEPKATSQPPDTPTPRILFPEPYERGPAFSCVRTAYYPRFPACAILPRAFI